MGGGAGWLLPAMQGLEGRIAHNKLDSRADSSLQALPPAHKGHKGWVNTLAEHGNRW